MKLSEIKIEPLLDTLRLEKISDEEYFSDKYQNYISNSRLTLLKQHPKNPNKFFVGLQKNYEFSDSLNRGSAVHECVLQPEFFYIVDSIDKPTAKAGAMADELYNFTGRMPSYNEMLSAAKKIGYYANSFNSKKAEALRNTCTAYWRSRAIYEHSDKKDPVKTPIYLDSKSREIVHNCIDALNDSKSIQNLLHPEDINKDLIGNEQAILLDVKITCPKVDPFRLRLKSKLDNYSIDKLSNELTVNDIKTTGNFVNMFKSAIEKFSYNREMAMYCWLLSLCAEKFYGLKKPTIKSNFLVVETFGNFSTKVCPMTPILFKTGFEEFKHLLRLAAFYSTLPEYEGFRESL